MGRYTKDQYIEVLEHIIQCRDESQSKIAKELGYTRFAFNKIIKGKQKLYLHEFLDIAYELKLLHPNATNRIKYRNEHKIINELRYEYKKLTRRKIELENEIKALEKERIVLEKLKAKNNH